MTRLLYSLMQLFMGKTQFDSLGVGEETELPPARFDKNKKQYTVTFRVKRDR